MLKLLPHQVCPFSNFCEYTQDGVEQCNGLNELRNIVFICELWKENTDQKQQFNRRVA